MGSRVPTEADAAAVLQCVWGEAIRAIQRLPTGQANWVYAIETTAGRRVVARLNRPGHGAHFAAAVAWQARLAPLDLPLARLLAHDADPADGGCPFMLIEELPGRDLGQVYPTLTRAEKRALAVELATIQRRVGTLPLGPGFGYALSYSDPALHPTWADVLRAELARSQRRIAAAGLATTAHGERVATRLARHERYLAAVVPRPFLDDTTTKNVLIETGCLSGIVDVDCVCFGDPLLTVALTQTSLLNLGYDTDYIADWCAELGLDDERRAVLALYTALFCVDFLSELGQTANRQTAAPVDQAQIDRLIAILENQLADGEAVRR